MNTPSQPGNRLSRAYFATLLLIALSRQNKCCLLAIGALVNVQSLLIYSSVASILCLNQASQNLAFTVVPACAVVNLEMTPIQAGHPSKDCI